MAIGCCESGEEIRNRKAPAGQAPRIPNHLSGHYVSSSKRSAPMTYNNLIEGDSEIEKGDSHIDGEPKNEDVPAGKRNGTTYLLASQSIC